MDWRHMSELLAAGKRAYTELKNFHRPGFEIKAGISAFHDGRRAVRNRGHLALCGLADSGSHLARSVVYPVQLCSPPSD
jgi:hypothetical protein